MARPAAVDRLAAMVIEKESRATEVARLLHDNAGQTLTAIGFHLHALGGDAEATAQIHGYLEAVLENVRLACNQLQSNVIERSGLALAIEMLVTRIGEESRLRVTIDMRVERKYPAAVGYAVYRVIELALDNVVRHSGVKVAEVQLRADDAGIRASVSDHGGGFDTEIIDSQPSGTGIALMQAYARSHQLHLRLDSSPGQGTIIQIQTI